MEIFIAICLIVAGLAIGFLGLKLFRLMLPLAGLLVGAVIGFTGMQGIFGTGVASTTVAIITACVFGLVMAVLSYAFFDIALVILVGLGISSLFTLLGVALGLSVNGFMMFMLSVSGFIIGLYLASASPLLSANLVTLATALVGMGLVLGGIFLIGSSVTLEELGTNGIINTVAERVHTSFWWVFIWMSGAIIMRLTQVHAMILDIFPDEFGYPAKSSK